VQEAKKPRRQGEGFRFDGPLEDAHAPGDFDRPPALQSGLMLRGTRFPLDVEILDSVPKKAVGEVYLP